MSGPDGQHSNQHYGGENESGDDDSGDGNVVFSNPLKMFGLATIAAVVVVAGIGFGFVLVNDDDSAETGSTTAAESAVPDTTTATESADPATPGVEADPNAPGMSIEACEDLKDLESLGDRDRSGFWEAANQEVTASIEEFARCLEFGEVVVLVNGTDMEGIYTNLDSGTRQVAVTGMGLAQDREGKDFPYFEHGQCFVGNPGEPFQTKVTQTHAGIIRVVEIGISFGGGDTENQLPFMGLVLEVLGAEPSVTNFYEPAIPDGNAVVTVDSERFEDAENPWAGWAILSTTTYNNRKFYPYKDAVYEPESALHWNGPAENVVVTVLCG